MARPADRPNHAPKASETVLVETGAMNESPLTGCRVCGTEISRDSHSSHPQGSNLMIALLVLFLILLLGSYVAFMFYCCFHAQSFTAP